jgi:hypothetical protein
VKYIRSIMFIIPLIVLGCKSDVVEPPPAPPAGSLAGVQAIREVETAHGTVIISLECEVSSTGWQFSHAATQRSGNTFDTKVFAVNKSQISTPILTTIKASVKQRGITPGTYTFRFWKSDQETVDTTVVVGN